MTRKTPLANPPAEASPLDPETLARLTDALENLAGQPADPELKCYTPTEVAEILGVTSGWVERAIRAGSVPHTYVGKFPRMTAAHIRQVQADGERLPNQYSRAAA